MGKWTYEGYWNTVLSPISAGQLIHDYELINDRRNLDEWLGHAEAEAWLEGGKGGDIPDEWWDYHTRALGEILDAFKEIEEA